MNMEQPVTPPPAMGALTTLRIDPAKISVEVGREINFVVWGAQSDGVEVDVTEHVTLESADPAILEQVTGMEARFKAVAPGDVEVRATIDALESISNVNVIDNKVATALTLSATELEVPARGTAMLTATLMWSDGSTEDVTQAATWSSSAPAIATVSAGVVTRVAAGMATISAGYMSLEASMQIKDPPPPPCNYPAGPTEVRLNGTMPNVSWSSAYKPDGTTMNFSLEDIKCGQEYQDKTIIVFVVGAAWCGPCTEYAQDMNARAAAIESAGAVIIFVEAQDTSYNLATSRYANTHLTRIIGNDAGLRVGDADTMPSAGTFNDAPLTTQFPTAFVVRKSDMKIIVNQADWNNMLPYAQIALHPDADWSNPNRPPEAPNCGPADEEVGEPNNSAAQATTIMAGSFMGGVCDSEADYYQITHPGNWTMELEFSHAVGDIDTFVWDPQTNAPARINGQQVGSDSGDDNEQFSHSGPALVKVYGYEGATAPYLLRLTTN